MSDFKKVRDVMGDGKSPFPMTFTLEECNDEYHIIPKDAQGVEGPPVHGRTPSAALLSITKAMAMAEKVADAIVDLVEKEIGEEASKN